MHTTTATDPQGTVHTIRTYMRWMGGPFNGDTAEPWARRFDGLFVFLVAADRRYYAIPPMTDKVVRLRVRKLEDLGRAMHEADRRWPFQPEFQAE